jgi:biopolymer transport protein ExbD
VSFLAQCPFCQTSYAAGEHLIGTQVRCPGCGEAVTVSAPSGQHSKPPVAVADPGDDEASGKLDLGEKRVVEEAEMDMTPMVDVTFQLLIFFMVTAAFAMQKSIEIPKPEQDQPSTQVQQKDPETDPEYIVVVVDEFNTYQVLADGIDPDDAEAPSEQELLRKLRFARDAAPGGVIPTKLLVKASGEALHEKVVAALDAGTEVGMEQVQLMTVEEGEY